MDVTVHICTCQSEVAKQDRGFLIVVSFFLSQLSSGIFNLLAEVSIPSTNILSCFCLLRQMPEEFWQELKL